MSQSGYWLDRFIDCTQVNIKDFKTFAAYSIIMWEKLKLKWGINSNWDVVAIIIVFAISGSSIMFVKPVWFSVLPFCNWL